MSLSQSERPPQELFVLCEGWLVDQYHLPMLQPSVGLYEGGNEEFGASPCSKVNAPILRLETKEDHFTDTLPPACTFCYIIIRNQLAGCAQDLHLRELKDVPKPVATTYSSLLVCIVLCNVNANLSQHTGSIWHHMNRRACFICQPRLFVYLYTR